MENKEKQFKFDTKTVNDSKISIVFELDKRNKIIKIGDGRDWWFERSGYVNTIHREAVVVTEAIKDFIAAHGYSS